MDRFNPPLQHVDSFGSLRKRQLRYVGGVVGFLLVLVFVIFMIHRVSANEPSSSKKGKPSRQKSKGKQDKGQKGATEKRDSPSQTRFRPRKGDHSEPMPEIEVDFSRAESNIPKGCDPILNCKKYIQHEDGSCTCQTYLMDSHEFRAQTQASREDKDDESDDPTSSAKDSQSARDITITDRMHILRRIASR